MWKIEDGEKAIKLIVGNRKKNMSIEIRKDILQNNQVPIEYIVRMSMIKFAEYDVVNFGKIDINEEDIVKEIKEKYIK